MTAGACWITEAERFRSMRRGAPDRDTAAADPVSNYALYREMRRGRTGTGEEGFNVS
jgi:hypothetical protein